MYFHQALVTYHEIIRTGQIQSTVDGDKVRIRMQGSISGDILISVSYTHLDVYKRQILGY